jgi:hypothetical protein
MKTTLRFRWVLSGGLLIALTGFLSELYAISFWFGLVYSYSLSFWLVWTYDLFKK